MKNRMEKTTHPAQEDILKTNSKLKDGVFFPKKSSYFFILFAFFIVFLSYVLPTPQGLSHEGQIMIGILVMAAILWITEPMPLAVTSLLIMILQPLLGVMPAGDVFASFGNKAVFFLIGAFILAAAIEKHGLHRRIALRFLRFFENRPKFFTFGIMTSCAFLSFVMPEHGVAALFLPIIASILIATKVVPRQSNFGKISMLCIAYGCSIGSLGTLVGGARNPLTIGILADLTHPINVTFFNWCLYSMPVVFITLPLVWLVLVFSFPIELKDISDAKKEIDRQVTSEGKIRIHELIVLGILILTICLWILFSSYQYFGLAAIAILSGVLLFFSGCISWSDVEQRVPWGIILLYGGAITLGIGIQNTGAGAWLAELIFNMVGDNMYVVILMMILFTILLTNVMSNVGAVAILLPIGIAVADKIGFSPLLSSMIIALCGGLAFMLVIGTPGNAIAYSSGYFSTRDLFKAGVVANVICIGIIFCVAIFYWVGVLHLEVA
jgi:sodium-dependent dicarboxylate transporter 2/3/5